MNENEIISLWRSGLSIQKISDIYLRENNKRKLKFEMMNKSQAYSYVERIIFNNMKVWG